MNMIHQIMTNQTIHKIDKLLLLTRVFKKGWFQAIAKNIQAKVIKSGVIQINRNISLSLI